MISFNVTSKTLLLALSLITLQRANGQCIKEISTNPTNPVNEEFLPMVNSWPGGGSVTVNSFLNTSINWYPSWSTHTIPVNIIPGWAAPVQNLGSTHIPMQNPFADFPNYLGDGSSFPRSLRDYWWEDGWELLWSNLGRYPNGDPLDNPTPGARWNESFYPSHPTAPYFALYNRYRGTVRLFSNVWFNPLDPFRYSDVNVKFGFDEISLLSKPVRVSGILRINGAYDLPLDVETEYTQTYSARKHPVLPEEWHISEFQVGFDPCICLKQKEPLKQFQSGKLEFVFNTFTTLNTDMMSRTVETTHFLTGANYADQALDFLNLSDINTGNYEPGYAMRKRMIGLFEDYEAKLEKYEQDLADYNHPMNQLKKELINMGKSMVTSGVGHIPINLPPAPLSRIGINSKAGYESANKTASNLLKGLVGLGYDYATFDINAEKPNKPTMPSANFAETFYKGEINQSNPLPVGGLLIPGAYSLSPDPGSPSPPLYGYGEAESMDPRRFPAYNKVLGQVALLESPVVEFGISSTEKQIVLDVNENGSWEEPCWTDYQIESSTTFSLKLTEALKVALNEVLDFDMNLTETYVNIEVTLVGSMSGNNIFDEEEFGFITDPFTIQENYTFEDFNNNLYLNHSFPLQTNNTIKNVYNSNWVRLAEVNQHTFTLNEYLKFDYRREGQLQYYDGLECEYFPNIFHDNYDGTYKIETIKLKLLHDMYFEQISPHGDQVNSTQVFTYLLYSDDGEGNEHFGKNVTKIDDPEELLKYVTGELILEDEHIDPAHEYVWEVQGNSIYINAENVIIKGQLTVEEGYELIIQSLYQIDALPQSNIGNNITLRIKKDWYDLEPFHYATEQEKYDFCNNTDKYQAGQISNKARERYLKEMEERALAEKARPKQFRLYPNPASSEVQIDLVGQEGTAIEFIDTKGQTLMKTEIAGNTGLNIEQLSPGVYIVRVYYTDGSTAVQRLVKL